MQRTARRVEINLSLLKYHTAGIRALQLYRNAAAVNYERSFSPLYLKLAVAAQKQNKTILT